MIPLDEARSYVLSGCPRNEVATVPIDHALGLVTAAAITSSGPIPPFDNTAMDGFAIRSADVADAPVSLRLVGTIAAGARPDIEVGPGEAVRIMTGAPMPPGADAVVMVELTTTADDGSTVDVSESVPVGNHIRPAGDDVISGQTVFETGTRLRPAHLGVCTSVGAY
ncbi:MAG: gephyrin-like molybdotransferase Glp, partial [Acidimicrobiales bacterium]